MRDKKANTVNEQDNPLGYEKESKLLVGFAIPCIISMLVTALYNIEDYRRKCYHFVIVKKYK